MERTRKVWGHRWLIRKDSTHATSYLELDKGYRCSFHRHQAKFNLFFVISGRVGIKTEDGEVVLTDGQSFTIEPGRWHEFRVYENSEMIEEMYVSYDEGDIERKVLGGPLDD